MIIDSFYEIGQVSWGTNKFRFRKYSSPDSTAKKSYVGAVADVGSRDPIACSRGLNATFQYLPGESKIVADALSLHPHTISLRSSQEKNTF